MSKSKNNKIPDEVEYILYMEALPDRYGPWYVSVKEYERILTVKRKYPEHFPWQAKYDSIPDSVHKAYNEDRWETSGLNSLNKDLQDGNKKGGGIFESMTTVGADKPEGPTDFRKYFQDYYDMVTQREQEAEDRRKKDEALWDKHYKKYGLKYRP